MVWKSPSNSGSSADYSSSRTQPFRWGTGWSQRHPLTTITRKSNAAIFGSFVFLLLTTESLILAQNERWRRGLGMQVERESSLRGVSTVANG